MAIEQDWAAYADQAFLAETDTILARTSAGAGVEVPGIAIISKRAGGVQYRARGNIRFDGYNGAPATPTEAFDWPVPVQNLVGFGNFTLQTMLAFTLPNDGDSFAAWSAWNIKLAQTANSTTSAGVQGLQFGGPGYLALLPQSSRTLIGATTFSPASVSTGAQVMGEVLSCGALAVVFWESRSGGVTATLNWDGWYTTGSSIFLFNGTGNIASINRSTGAYTALSDRERKKDFEPASIGLAEVLLLRPTLYRMADADDDSPKQLGFVQQEVEEAIPQACTSVVAADATGEETVFRGLIEMPIIAALVNAVQELAAEVEALKAQAS